MCLQSAYEEGKISVAELLFNLLLNEEEAELEVALNRLIGVDAAFFPSLGFQRARRDFSFTGLVGDRNDQLRKSSHSKSLG
ncbi:MAG: hypothetical protein AAF394_03095 [Planctomycetota bacterium]